MAMRLQTQKGEGARRRPRTDGLKQAENVPISSKQNHFQVRPFRFRDLPHRFSVAGYY